MATQDEPTRYQRVQDILNDAQGRSVPEYDGKHAFWMLPLDEFLAVEIYGQRMIAPGEERGDEPGGETEGCGCGHCAGSGDTEYCWPTGGTSGPSRGTTRSGRSASARTRCSTGCAATSGGLPHQAGRPLRGGAPVAGFAFWRRRRAGAGQNSRSMSLSMPRSSS